MKFNERLKLVKKILAQSQYQTQKDTIQSLFSKTSDVKREDIILRLVVIDSGYSTQMSKRLFPFEDIADIILDLSDQISSSINAVSFFEDNEKILLNSFGIDKKGATAGRAFSLISKYLYFVTNYNFPIYDKLVFEGLKQENLLKKSLSYVNVEYFKILESIVNEYNITYDLLDQYFWTIGKIRKGSLSLLISNKKEYIENFIQKLNLSEDEKTTKDFDTLISQKLKEVSFQISPLFEISTLAKDISITTVFDNLQLD